MPVGIKEQVQGQALSEAISIMRQIKETPLWRHLCLRLQDLMVLARDELEECNSEKEMWITQGGIRMLRKIVDWDAELRDDIQQKIMREEIGDAERGNNGFHDSDD